jgi:hydrogenase maturation protease
MTHILIAGIGNIFLGDDAFGVEVARRLMERELPPGVQVVDFGIRSYDLAFALLEHPAATILLDATPRGGEPGTLYLLALSMDDVPAQTEPPAAQDGPLTANPMDAHSMNPVAALQLVRQYGGNPQNLYLVGAEPATLVAANGDFGLSAPLQQAVPAAIDMVQQLLDDLCTNLA